MRKLSLNIFIAITFLFFGISAWSDDADVVTNHFNLDKTQVVIQQIDLVKNRIVQAKNEYAHLKSNQEYWLTNFSVDHVNKKWLTWAKLDIAVAKSNLNSIDIEVSEAQQMSNMLSKDSQELTNQINAYSIFGSKVAHNGALSLNSLRAQLVYQKNLLRLENERLAELEELQSISDKILQLHNIKLGQIENFLKSQTLMELKERQGKSEIDFQQQQQMWLQRVNILNGQLQNLEKTNPKDKIAYVKLENEIFYASENVNFMYLQMLIERYQDQIQQLKLSSSRGTSITLLNNVSDQIQAVSKQITRVKELLDERLKILEERKGFLLQEKFADQNYLNEMASLVVQYHAELGKVNQLNADVTVFRGTLDKAVQEELSHRQGLLGFGTKAWLDLGHEIVLVPTLTYEVGKSLTEVVMRVLFSAQLGWWLLLGSLELAWVGIYYISKTIITRLLKKIPDHAQGHINITWLVNKLLQRNLLDLFIITNLIGFFILCGVQTQYFRFVIDLGLVWLLFKTLIIISRLCFVETVHDRSQADVNVYQRLNWTFLLGGFISGLTVFLYQLPGIFEIKDLFYRLFLLFLAIVSIFLLKWSGILSGLVLPHIDEQRTYLKRMVRLLSILIPLVLLIDSLIGLFGFFNFVLTVSWYESIFFLVLAGYLIIKGILGELISLVSHFVITNVKNGWLWSEALLKPLDKILSIFLFLSAIVILFFLYGWDQQSPVVGGLVKVLYYPLGNVLGTTVTITTIIELIMIISFLYWAARWIREFVYRIMSSRTSDLGIRTSIAILSQYILIVCGVLIGLRLLGIDLKALTFIVSAFALGVGLGLRDIANNFVCGFLLLFERPLRVGDTVSINGIDGDVVHIGGRAVTIRTFDHMDLVVPNADIFSKSFINWTAKDSIVRTVVMIKIDQTDKPLEVQSLIYDTLMQHKKVLKDPVPEVFLKDIQEGLIEFEMRYYINLRQVISRMEVRSDVLMTIWSAFEKAGIKPPHPHHEILVNAPLLARS